MKCRESVSAAALFDHLAVTPAVLGNPTVIPGVGVTHLRYTVGKGAEQRPD